MLILSQPNLEHKSEAEVKEALQHAEDQARRAIKRFAGDNWGECQAISQQFECDLAECTCSPLAYLHVCDAYIWLAKGL